MATIVPILRIFDYHKAIEFYVHWLGFRINWTYQPENTPVVLEISFQDITILLSEHHGDGTPGTKICVRDFAGLKAYHQDLLNKNYKYNRPGIERPEWDPKVIEVTLSDPFGNNLILSERLA